MKYQILSFLYNPLSVLPLNKKIVNNFPLHLIFLYNIYIELNYMETSWKAWVCESLHVFACLAYICLHLPSFEPLHLSLPLLLKLTQRILRLTSVLSHTKRWKIYKNYRSDKIPSQIFKYSSIWVFKYSSIQVFKYSSIQV